MKKVILIPGLGYTDRIFEKLKISHSEVHNLNWIEPAKDESIGAYASRMIKPLVTAEDEIILIGHSFGGMIAQEIASQISIKKIVLLSSIKSRKELPSSFRLISRLKCYHFFTKEISIKTVKYWGKNHGLNNELMIDLFRQMVGSYSNNYLQWALKNLGNWHSPSIPSSTKLVQIHGANDKTFPAKLIQPDIMIEDGDHIMVYQMSEKISTLLNQEIKITFQ